MEFVSTGIRISLKKRKPKMATKFSYRIQDFFWMYSLLLLLVISHQCKVIKEDINCQYKWLIYSLTDYTLLHSFYP